MKLKFSTLRLLVNPFPFICYLTGILILVKNIIYLANYDPFFDPLLVWGTISIIAYFLLTTLFHKKNNFFLFMFYILESTFRIAYSTAFTHCDPKFEILLISFFILTYLFSNEAKKYRFLYILLIILISLTILHTFYFKYTYFLSVEQMNDSQLLFCKVEVFSNIIITCVLLILVSLYSSLNLKKMFIKNETTQKKLEYITCHDILTGLMNRYLARSYFSTCESRKLNESIDYAIAILDIDDFKKINDIYGHDCGDFVLKSYTQELRAKLSPQIHIARWGGEEFVIIFPRITSETIFDLDTIRELLALTPFYYNGKIIHVSATYGMSSSRNWKSAIEVLNDADENLLIGKQNGKNRLVVSQKF